MIRQCCVTSDSDKWSFGLSTQVNEDGGEVLLRGGTPTMDLEFVKPKEPFSPLFYF